MEALALQTGAPTVHWEDNQGCTSVVEDNIFTLRVTQIEITVYFL